MLTTEAGKMRFRVKFNDAPEVYETFRLYREDDGNGRKVTIYHADIGIQSLYYARKLIVHSSKVYLEIALKDGQPFLDKDHYGRRLVNIWLQERDNVRIQIICRHLVCPV